ncbi:MAG: tolB protein precursor, partial [Chryseobacterium sp.]
SNGHIDDFNFIESAGAWSPDSKQFAFSIFSHGKNQMMIINVANGSTVSQTAMEQVQQFGNLTWSPNGKDIAFSGMVEGQSDIFSYNLDTKVITQITNDVYSDYAPSFSPDGKKIVFSSDRAAIQNKNINAVLPINLAIYDIASKAVSNLDVFPGANNLNAQFSANSQNIYFLSNRDGFRNLYKYNFADNTVDQLTDYFTGISGITEFSPAISVSNTDDIVYSYYRYQRYTLYNAPLSSFKAKRIGNQEENFDAAILPPMENFGVNIINSNLNNFDRFEKIIADSMKTVAYRPKFKLDYLANSGVGVSTSRFGTGVSGGIVGMFSDILGTNQIIANISVNGEIYDAGGLVGYINQKSRINWGAAISHIPYVSGFSSYGYEKLPGDNNTSIDALSERTDIIRTFEDQLQIFGAYPFSKKHRFELGGAFSHYSYRIDRYSNYYNNAGYYIGSDRKRLDNDQATLDYGVPFRSFTLYQLNAGFVGDNSIFGLTGPLDGFRYRVAGEKYFGTYNFAGATADLRKYWRLKPVTVAARSYNTFRIGKDADRLYPMYVG